jgi:hypothetical protein
MSNAPTGFRSAAANPVATAAAVAVIDKDHQDSLRIDDLRYIDSYRLID